MSVRAFFDRQLSVRSWPKTGLSPLNLAIVVLIVSSALMFALETEPSVPADWRPVLFALNLVVLVAFAAEFALRIWAAGASVGITGFGARMAYAEPAWLVIDFLAFAPELGILVYVVATGDSSVLWVEGFKLVRLLRVGKLVRYVPGMKLLFETIFSVRRELIASVTIAATLIFVSAVLIYFAEGAADPENFGSVLRSLWWSVVTLTTVGYGDVLPHTVPGRAAAGVIAIVGVGLVALPSGIIAGAFIERLRVAHRRGRAPDDETSE